MRQFSAIYSHTHRILIRHVRQSCQQLMEYDRGYMVLLHDMSGRIVHTDVLSKIRFSS